MVLQPIKIMGRNKRSSYEENKLWTGYILIVYLQNFQTLTYNPFRDTNSVIHMWAILLSI